MDTREFRRSGNVEDRRAGSPWDPIDHALNDAFSGILFQAGTFLDPADSPTPLGNDLGLGSIPLPRVGPEPILSMSEPMQRIPVK